MKKLLVFSLIAVLAGCSVFRRNPDVYAPSDALWEKVKKRAEERRKADEAQKKTMQTQEWEKLNKQLERFQDQGRSSKK
jgi:deoxyadenosine/deoxycytidine kinase